MKLWSAPLLNTDLLWGEAGWCLVPGAVCWMLPWLAAKPGSRHPTDTVTWQGAQGGVPRSRCLGRYGSVDGVKEGLARGWRWSGSGLCVSMPLGSREPPEGTGRGATVCPGAEPKSEAVWAAGTCVGLGTGEGSRCPGQVGS